MDDSMSDGDSLFSLPGPSIRGSGGGAYHTPTRPQFRQHAPSVGHGFGLGLHPDMVPQHLPEIDDSVEYPHIRDTQWNGNASPLEPDASASYIYEGVEGANDEDGPEEEEEREEGSYAESEGSSAQYDPDADPEGFARRLDELAGIMEVGEEEARALRWGPAIGRERDAPDLPLADFKALINHHLASTEWRYSSPSTLFPPVPGRPSASIIPDSMGMDLTFDTGDTHPIRVLPRGWEEMDEMLLMEEPEGSPQFRGGGLQLSAGM